jgi:hypothetical protein
MLISEFTGVKSSKQNAFARCPGWNCYGCPPAGGFHIPSVLLTYYLDPVFITECLNIFLFILIICSVDRTCLNWIPYSYQCNGCNVYWHYINTVNRLWLSPVPNPSGLSVTGVMLVSVILCNNNGFWSNVCFFYEFVKIQLLLDEETFRMKRLFVQQQQQQTHCGISTLKLMKS